MDSLFHHADTRGSADHGWLKSRHSFSFANFQDPDKMGFGCLRVLNDDLVVGGMGFARHPHSNMEIISILLEGALKHKDDMGNQGVINTGDVQIMSAGTGIYHSELNNHPAEPVNFLQLWVLPKEQNITPRYDQQYFNKDDRFNKWQTLVSPERNNGMWINQDAYLRRANLEMSKSLEYRFHGSETGVYVFLIKGEVDIEGQILEERDALGIWNTNKITIQANDDSEILSVEVPIKSKK